MKPKNPLNSMEIKAKKIKTIQYICNTILANACYHSKEMETQIATAEKTGNLSDDEKKLILNAWDYRCDLAHELITDLNEYMRLNNARETKTDIEKKHRNKK